MERTRGKIKSLLIGFIVMLCSFSAIAQTDSTKTGKGVNYIEIYIEIYHSFTNDAGSMSDRSNLSIEFGRQWGVFSAGVDVGKTTLSSLFKGRDTSTYVEFRPNLNIFQQDKFTNTITVGVGYVFNAQSSFLTEMTAGIEYSLNKKIHLNANFGQFYYSGLKTSSNVTFFGFSATYYFLK